MDKKTQQPVAWLVSVADEPELGHWFAKEACSHDGHNCVPLYTHQPVPRDVLMAFGEAVLVKAGVFMYESDIAALADRYASQVQPERVAWGVDKKTILALAAELVRGAECMGDDETEFTLEVRAAGTVQDDDGRLNAGPVLAIFDTEYPEEGVYPIDPANPTGGREPEIATQPEPVERQLVFIDHGGGHGAACLPGGEAMPDANYRVVVKSTQPEPVNQQTLVALKGYAAFADFRRRELGELSDEMEAVDAAARAAIAAAEAAQKPENNK